MSPTTIRAASTVDPVAVAAEPFGRAVAHKDRDEMGHAMALARHHCAP